MFRATGGEDYDISDTTALLDLARLLALFAVAGAAVGLLLVGLAVTLITLYAPELLTAFLAIAIWATPIGGVLAVLIALLIAYPYPVWRS